MPCGQERARISQPARPGLYRHPPLPALDACFNCEKSGHYAAECPQPKQSRDWVRAAHMEVPGDNLDCGETGAEGNQSSVAENNGMNFHGSDHDGNMEEIEVDVYDNDYYFQDSDNDIMAAMTELPTDQNDHEEWDVKMCWAMMEVSKEAHVCPVVSSQLKECLATFTMVEGHKAWTLWDSGSTTMGIMPSSVNVAKITVFPLKNPHVLQLGTIGSCASVNFGTYVEIATHGTSQREYVDVANFDCYDMIIGTPFMRTYKVILDFVNNTVCVGE